jgi:hypothetical protein
MQYICMPLLASLSAYIFNATPIQRLALIIACSCPGGGTSSVMCYISNADVQTSIMLTSVSSICALVAVPINLLIYAGPGVELPWLKLGLGAGSVIVGVAASRHVPSSKRKLMSHVGGAAGLANMVLALVSSPVSEGSHRLEIILWAATPCAAGVLITWLISAFASGPKRVALCVETAYQNTALATAIISSFGYGSDAISIIISYGTFEPVVIVPFCTLAWLSGATYAPPKSSVWACIFRDHQPKDIVPSTIGTDIGSDDADIVYPSLENDRTRLFKIEENMEAIPKSPVAVQLDEKSMSQS